MHISWYDKGKERRHLMKLENKEQNIVETESEFTLNTTFEIPAALLNN